MNDTPLLYCFQELVFFAASELLGDIQYEGSGSDGFSCFCDFSTKAKAPTQLEPFQDLLQRKLLELAKKDLSIDLFEMVQENAKAYLEEIGAHFALSRLQGNEDQIATFCRIGDFVDHCLPTEVPSTAHLRHFRLLPTQLIEQNKKSTIRVEAICCADEKSVKESFKKWKESDRKGHLKVGSQQKFFTFHQRDCFWLEKGVWLKEKINQFFIEQLQKKGYKIVETGVDKIQSHQILFSQFPSMTRLLESFCHFQDRTSPRFCALFEPEKMHSLFLSRVCAKKEMLDEIISSLQLICDLFKLFSLDVLFLLQKSRGEGQLLAKALQKSGFAATEKRGQGSQIQGLVLDKLGRGWPMCSLKVVTFDSQKSAIHMTILESVERMVAFLLEQREGVLPYWLAFEQLRLIPGKDGKVAAAMLLKKWQKMGVRARLDESSASIENKIAYARRDLVPYTAVVQNEEEISLYRLHTRKMQSLKPGRLIDELEGMED